MKDCWKLMLSLGLVVVGAGGWLVSNRIDADSFPLRAVDNPVKLGPFDGVVNSVVVTLRNFGSCPIEIVAVRKGCTCQQVYVPKTTVLPGCNAIVNVELDCRGKKGRFRSMIEVEYRIHSIGDVDLNAGSPVLLERIVLDALVNESIEERGVAIEWKVELEAKEKATQFFQWFNPDGSIRRIESARSRFALVEVEKAANNSAVELSLDLSSVSKPVEFEIEVQFEGEGSRVVCIPVKTFVGAE